MDNFYEVNYLDDPESMQKFVDNHAKISFLTRDELIEMIVIYNQLYRKANDIIQENKRVFEQSIDFLKDLEEKYGI
jgi:hypothetical protein